MRSIKKVVTLFFVLVLLCPSLWAAPPPVAVPSNIFPGAVDAGVSQKRLERAIARPTAPSKVQLQAPPQPSPFAAGAKIRFTLKKIILSGNKIYSTQELEHLYQSYLGKEISLADLGHIVELITNYYRDHGFVLSRALIPPQTIKNGVVRITIVEGYVDKVSIKGTDSKSQQLVYEYGKHIQEVRPLNIEVLERYLLLANDIAGSTVRAILTPSKTQRYAADLTLLNEQRRGIVYLSYDNYGTRFLGPHQISLGGNLYSLFGAGDNTALSLVQTDPGRDLKFIDLRHMHPIGSKGALLTVDYNYTRTNPGSTLRILDIIGHNKNGFIDMSYPVIRSRKKNFTVHGMFNYQNTITTILQEPLYADRIRALQLGIYYDFLDRWLASNALSLNADHGFKILGASNAGLHSRLGGRSNYTRINAEFYRTQYFNPYFSFYFDMQGQYAFVPLYAAEQYAYGGPYIGRGYDPAELLGDKAIAGKMELRLDQAPQKLLLRTVQYYLFYDGGVVTNIDAKKSGLDSRASATSTGLGMRILFTNHLNANVYLAKPLTRPVTNVESEGKNGKAPRGFFKITANI